jgi:hypothetical protein
VNKRQRRTLKYIFEDPVRSNIPWNDVVSLFYSLGAEVSKGKGSRVRVALRGVKAVFHKPHPENDTDKGAVMSVRKFLLTAEIDPDSEE